MAKISVIIPVYNTEKYLKRCFDSVKNQTLKDIEIICINDASTDSSLRIIQDYALKDKRIKLINLLQNVGTGNSRNEALYIARGQYLSFVDSDDEIESNFYEELYNRAIDTNADIVKSELINIESDGSIKKSNLNNLIINKSKFYFLYEFTSAIYKSSMIFDNNIKFPTDLIVGEDVVFLHKAILKAKKVEVINDTNYYYIRRENSLNTNIYDEKRMVSAIKTVEYMAKNYDDSLKLDISCEEYLMLYLTNIFSIIEYIITKTNEEKLKRKCIEKFIELYNKCKISERLDDILSGEYDELLNYIKNNKVENILEICLKYKNFKNYYTIKKLKQNVKKDMLNGKNFSNNSCI